MATLWDDSMKLLIGENAQDFVSWIMKGAEVKAKLATEFKGQELRADVLLQVEMIGLSGKKYLDFDFDSIEVYKMSAAELQQMGLPGLLPLMILTKDGATREVADTIFTELEAAGRLDSLSPTYVLVSLAFGKDNIADQRWLLRRLENMQEQLNESPVYQEMTRMAREAGFEVGLEHGLQQGQLQALREMVAEIVFERFPELLRLAGEKAANVNEPILLRKAALKLSRLTTAEEARQVLLTLNEGH